MSTAKSIANYLIASNLLSVPTEAKPLDVTISSSRMMSRKQNCSKIYSLKEVAFSHKKIEDFFLLSSRRTVSKLFAFSCTDLAQNEPGNCSFPLNNRINMAELCKSVGGAKSSCLENHINKNIALLLLLRHI